MQKTPCRYLACLLTAFLLSPPMVRAGDDAFFERKIRPILADTCFKCHGGEKTNGKLRVDSRKALLNGGRSGPALVPGDPDKSLLVRALRHAKDVEPMPPPPNKKLADDAVADFALWVKNGAPWPAKQPPNSFTVKKHWAFEPLRKVQPPDDPRFTHPIDRFLSATWKAKGVSPVERADQRTLARRVYFDLIGLPPTPEEVDAFVNDNSPEPFTKLIERLLASSHHGERWGRHWLDVVRYADTAGETADFPVPDAWRYRNYVINAFNTDKPYDQFLREQLAGDILANEAKPQPTRERYAELVIATGYLAGARRFGFDTAADHYLTLEDTIDVFGKSALGLTIACARCHDHKYDPISANDYYALYGIFDSTRYPFPGCEKVNRPKDMVSLVPLWEMKNDPKTLVGQAYAVIEGKPHHVALHKRGDPKSPGEIVPRGFLEIFGGQTVKTPDKTSGRLQLADWLTGPASHLTARVMVNRIWQHHFGAGLVKTPNDFGTRGDPPSHPELLDYLAQRFIDSGWSVKAMHRLILGSEAYQRSSTHHDKNAQVDPGNAWLWKYSRRRLSAEEIRDAVLQVSGDLDRTPGEAHPFPDAKKWGYTQHNPFSAVYDHDRRSVYLMTQRIKRHPFLALFDGADANASTPFRHTTTVPTQSLFFMNDPFIHAKATSLATRLSKLENDDARLERACRLFYGRAPSARERDVNRRFLDETLRETKGVDAGRNAWAAWLRVMFASNEFVYVD
jgi:cytochrome c553